MNEISPPISAAKLLDVVKTLPECPKCKSPAYYKALLEIRDGEIVSTGLECAACGYGVMPYYEANSARRP
jgi:hypothetical protein